MNIESVSTSLSLLLSAGAILTAVVAAGRLGAEEHKRGRRDKGERPRRRMKGRRSDAYAAVAPRGRIRPRL